jgi:hypothetical protein
MTKMLHYRDNRGKDLIRPSQTQPQSTGNFYGGETYDSAQITRIFSY